MLKSTDLGHKLVFDDEGKPHELYEMEDAEEFFKAGAEGIKAAGNEFAQGERGKLRVADIVDKEEAKDKKREKKRKRKERENNETAQQDNGIGFAILAPVSDDGNTPEFDPSSEEGEGDSPPTKRSKASRTSSGKPHSSTLEDEEELALQFLRQR